MITVNLKDIRNLLPAKTIIDLKKDKITAAYSLHILVPPKKALSEKEFETAKETIRLLIGKDNIQEIYTNETGIDWYVYCKRSLTLKFK